MGGAVFPPCYLPGAKLWCSHEEIPHAQGKRNPSKMVGIARGHQKANTLKPYSQETSQSNHTRTTAFSNSMRLSHASGATQNRRVMVERSDRMWSTGEGNGKPFEYSWLEKPMNSMKRQKDRTRKDELPRWVAANMLLEMSGEIASERMKGRSQSKPVPSCGCGRWWR